MRVASRSPESRKMCIRDSPHFDPVFLWIKAFDPGTGGWQCKGVSRDMKKERILTDNWFLDVYKRQAITDT